MNIGRRVLAAVISAGNGFCVCCDMLLPNICGNRGDHEAVYPENECKPPWLIKCLKCGSNKKARAIR